MLVDQLFFSNFYLHWFFSNLSFFERDPHMDSPEVIQVKQQYVRGHLPLSFNSLWITREAHRVQAMSLMVLHNDAEFFVPFLRLTQTSLLPYYCFPHIQRKFDQLYPSLVFFRDKNEFNTELKKLSTNYYQQKTYLPILLPNFCLLLSFFHNLSAPFFKPYYELTVLNLTQDQH